MMKKIAIVTGGSSGIGLAITKRLIDKKIKVIVIDIKEVDRSFFGIKSEYLSFYHCDLADVYELDKTIKEIKKEYPFINYLINNAAIQFVEPLENIDIHHFNEVINTNLRAPFILTKEFSPCMKNGCHILNISSVHGETARTDKYAYDASKAALNSFTKECALALAKRGIAVNAVSCGATNTSMNEFFANKKILKNATEKIPFGRVAMPDEVAKLACFLLLDSTYITGQIIAIDGGRSISNL